MPAADRQTSDRAVQMLAILQRDGRLVDFLMEDLAAYPDAQVGAAVRDVHRRLPAGARHGTSRSTPVLDDAEGADRDRRTRAPIAARIKIVGNVAGSPPFRGVAAPPRLGGDAARAAAAAGHRPHHHRPRRSRSWLSASHGLTGIPSLRRRHRSRHHQLRPRAGWTPRAGEHGASAACRTFRSS